MPRSSRAGAIERAASAGGEAPIHLQATSWPGPRHRVEAEAEARPRGWLPATRCRYETFVNIAMPFCPQACCPVDDGRPAGDRCGRHDGTGAGLGLHQEPRSLPRAAPGNPLPGQAGPGARLARGYGGLLGSHKRPDEAARPRLKAGTGAGRSPCQGFAGPLGPRTMAVARRSARMVRRPAWLRVMGGGGGGARPCFPPCRGSAPSRCPAPAGAVRPGSPEEARGCRSGPPCGSRACRHCGSPGAS